MSDIKFQDYQRDYENIIDDSIDKTLNNQKYEQAEAQNWCNQISDEVIKQISNDSNKPDFKFICNASVFQKGSASLNYLSTILWDPQTDGQLLDKKNLMICFALLPYLVLNK